MWAFYPFYLIDPSGSRTRVPAVRCGGKGVRARSNLLKSQSFISSHVPFVRPFPSLWLSNWLSKASCKNASDYQSRVPATGTEGSNPSFSASGWCTGQVVKNHRAEQIIIVGDEASDRCTIASILSSRFYGERECGGSGARSGAGRFGIAGRLVNGRQQGGFLDRLDDVRIASRLDCFLQCHGEDGSR